MGSAELMGGFEWALIISAGVGMFAGTSVGTVVVAYLIRRGRRSAPQMTVRLVRHDRQTLSSRRVSTDDFRAIERSREGTVEWWEANVTSLMRGVEVWNMDAEAGAVWKQIISDLHDITANWNRAVDANLDAELSTIVTEYLPLIVDRLNDIPADVLDSESRDGRTVRSELTDQLVNLARRTKTLRDALFIDDLRDVVLRTEVISARYGNEG